MSSKKILHAVARWLSRFRVVERRTPNERESRERHDERSVSDRVESADEFDPETLSFVYEDAKRVLDHQGGVSEQGRGEIPADHQDNGRTTRRRAVGSATRREAVSGQSVSGSCRPLLRRFDRHRCPDVRNLRPAIRSRPWIHRRSAGRSSPREPLACRDASKLRGLARRQRASRQEKWLVPPRQPVTAVGGTGNDGTGNWLGCSVEIGEMGERLTVRRDDS